MGKDRRPVVFKQPSVGRWLRLPDDTAGGHSDGIARVFRAFPTPSMDASTSTVPLFQLSGSRRDGGKSPVAFTQ